MPYLSEILELIRIANLLLPHSDIPDYADEIHIRFGEKSGLAFVHAVDKFFTMQLSDGNFLTIDRGISGEEYLFDVTNEIWDEISNNYPHLAQYAANAHKTVLGRFFELPKSYKGNETYENELTVLKVQNFIRLVRIGWNIQRVTVITSGWLWSGYSAWQNDNYSIYGDNKIHPFTINPDGTAKFEYGIVQFYLEKIDVLRIKACPYCFRIFWAKPKHTKYCSNECRNRQNVKRNYQKHKREILERKKQSYKEIRNKNGTL